MTRIKIKVNQCHFAYINSDLLKAFNAYAGVINMTSFIKESFYNEFGFLIRNAEDIETVDVILKDNFYTDKAEWLREIMRNKIKERRGDK